MKKILVPVACLILLANVLIVLRVWAGGIRLAEMYPELQYLVEMEASMDLRGQTASVKFFLPKTTDTQRTDSERVESGQFVWSVQTKGGNRIGRWRADDVDGREVGIYRTLVSIDETRYALPRGVEIPAFYPERVARYLVPSELIQSEDDGIEGVVQALVDSVDNRELAPIAKALFDFVHDQIRSGDPENKLDAVTALKWREAGSGGKARLLTGLFRAAGIPARVVGGMALSPGSGKDLHQWVEAWINGVWVPFDALHGHFAYRPNNYLMLYHGDHEMFKRTANTNFRYMFNVKEWRTPPEDILPHIKQSYFNTYVFWGIFREAHISLNLLRILLLLPVGVLVIIFFRNFVGIQTLGTFMPALMAIAFRDMGLVWGMALFMFVLALGLLIRAGLERVQLLHTPRLAIVLMFVVTVMLGVSFFFVRVGALEGARISMFPIAVLTISIESAFIKMQELGVVDTIKVLLGTIFVVIFAHLAMHSYFIQALVFVFPEVMLVVLALYLMVGRWVGLRLLEYHRFRWLLVR